MAESLCKKCGFYYIENDNEKCYISKKIIDFASVECKTYITRQYDGNEPFTPEEHEWLFKDDLEQKKMKNIQGLKF
ncbi:MAG: hypothetical protein FWD71_16105 [Oscillospiraceae bacterium]|nr:hypothetical protein [Oscillospiraceae bacterium]